MPRSRRSSSPSRHVSSSTHAPPPVKAPPPASHPPPPAQSSQQQSGGLLSGIGSTIMQGMAFGTGSSIAHHAVGAMVGSGGKHETKPESYHHQPSVEKEVRSSSDNICQPDMDAFKRCMKENNDNAAACEFYYNALQQCQAYNPSSEHS